MLDQTIAATPTTTRKARFIETSVEDDEPNTR
jgi:hypothetical protein